jgi:hypothetical protein
MGIKIGKNRIGDFISDATAAALVLKQNKLTAGTNVTIDVTDPLNPVINANGGGGGDMTTTTTQTVSGVKTFLDGMFGFRNVANTFTSFFSNSATASRTYTFQDRNGTILDSTDLTTLNNAINAKAPAYNGTVNFLSKFLTATTIGISRIIDTGSFLGIGTANTPTKDLTFGNQANKKFGIEDSYNVIDGRELVIEAGRSINFVINSNFNRTFLINRNLSSIAVAPNGDVYLGENGGDIYMQTAGKGNFIALGQTSRSWNGIAAAPNGNIYACVLGDIYMQTAGTGNFIALGQTSRLWKSIAASPNGNIYACVSGGDIYIQTAGTGNFIATGGLSRNWEGITIAPNTDVYAITDAGLPYKQTGGTGSFVTQSAGAGYYWKSIAAAPNGNIYATEAFNVFMQTGGTGSFVALGQTDVTFKNIAVATNGNVYAVRDGIGDIYLQTNLFVGYNNLDGGALKLKAGTGKGTGKSRYEIWTGQKTTSGTDMQIETLREYVDENGYHIYTSMPVYADNTAATTAGLPVGCKYRTSTGLLMIRY